MRTYLPDLLLGAKIRSFVAQLLDHIVSHHQIVRDPIALDVETGILIVQLLVALGEIIELATLANALVLDHTVTILEALY